MSFSDLRPGRVRDYIEARRGDGLWVFQHIPKTAGSSLSAELARHRAPYRNVHVAYLDKSRSMDERRDEARDLFLAEVRSTGLRSASGHLRFSDIEKIREALPDVRLMTFVRDPVERVVSEYYYSTSPEHSDPDSFLERFPTLDSFAASNEATNKMAVFITGNRRIKPDDLVATAFERFDFIGNQKLYTLSFRLLSTMLWRQTSQRARLRVSGRGSAREGLSPGLLEVIRRNNRADQALFKAVTDVYTACRDELNVVLKEMLEAHRRAVEAGKVVEPPEQREDDQPPA